ncbi:hypothetical protein G6O69_19330 [Pseudenhygromyxa sp. WMMC2535]|uniref:hypothetical protein n=1 Tax=Pseudenhygromyxa sp. WMMC2535 TaxID=2712867 RepID=UPI0015530F19|nr:hypothetical protein [Pseudenhygromyxa sp. WMMC2535]NVB40006.1 hypothetical protein [Pseudenhygromyxa sp. WMMC2535]
MTSPDPKSKQGSDGGGMLPALLAGVGILLVAALFFFGGDEDEDKAAAKEAAGKDQASASSRTASGSSKTGIAARRTDDAQPSAPKPRLNPRIANSMVGSGMAPNSDKPEEPSSFESKDEEIIYWEDELRAANQTLEMRQRAMEHIPAIEEKIRNGKDAERSLAEFEKRKEVVEENLEKAEDRVKTIEEKLEKLRG